MLLIDSFRPSRKRGTFMNFNGLQRIWNELDVAMILEKAANTVNTVRTIDTNLSDHRCKGLWPELAKKVQEILEKKSRQERGKKKSSQLQSQECDVDPRKLSRKEKR